MQVIYIVVLFMAVPVSIGSHYSACPLVSVAYAELGLACMQGHYAGVHSSIGH